MLKYLTTSRKTHQLKKLKHEKVERETKIYGLIPVFRQKAKKGCNKTSFSEKICIYDAMLFKIFELNAYLES